MRSLICAARESGRLTDGLTGGRMAAGEWTRLVAEAPDSFPAFTLTVERQAKEPFTHCSSITAQPVRESAIETQRGLSLGQAGR